MCCEQNEELDRESENTQRKESYENKIRIS